MGGGGGGGKRGSKCVAKYVLYGLFTLYELLICNFIINIYKGRDEKLWILLSWLHVKPADQDLHSFRKQV